MTATKGYFSLVQYCPDIARREAANVGVVLFSPEHRFIEAKVISSNHRIRRFFGVEADNYQHLNSMKAALAHRLELERDNFTTLEDLETFVRTRANKVILTDPKPVKIFDPKSDLEALFSELVLEPTRPLSVQAELPLRTRLDDVLMSQGVRQFVRTNISVRVPTLNEQVQIPYGYQNGRLNLIQPMSFAQKFRARVKNAACKTALEGLSLHRHKDPQLGDLQLVVVAEFIDSDSETVNLVRDIFREGSVEMYTTDTLDSLRHDIVTHGKLTGEDRDLFSAR